MLADGIQVTDSVLMPLENGIQDLGFRMDPGFHPGDDTCRNYERTVEFSSNKSKRCG